MIRALLLCTLAIAAGDISSARAQVDPREEILRLREERGASAERAYWLHEEERLEKLLRKKGRFLSAPKFVMEPADYDCRPEPQLVGYVAIEGAGFCQAPPPSCVRGTVVCEKGVRQ